MIRDKRAIFTALTILLAGYAGAPPAQAQNQEPPTAAEMVTDYLKQDIFLEPGVGLKSVRIGTSFAQVRQEWGAPTRTDRHDLIDEKWIYEIADHTRIALIGGDSVEAIRVEGSFNSPYGTTEGASFGMPRHQLATIYGAGKSGSNNLTYDKRGVGFVLRQGQVSEIRIFPPD
ncbi:MAG TPA: hypothetical protein VK973_00390 [Arenicellales bacterium]|nr:hypothetical protein [Arenicellales bacterium]